MLDGSETLFADVTGSWEGGCEVCRVGSSFDSSCPGPTFTSIAVLFEALKREILCCLALGDASSSSSSSPSSFSSSAFFGLRRGGIVIGGISSGSSTTLSNDADLVPKLYNSRGELGALGSGEWDSANMIGGMSSSSPSSSWTTKLFDSTLMICGGYSSDASQLSDIAYNCVLSLGTETSGSLGVVLGLKIL